MEREREEAFQRLRALLALVALHAVHLADCLIRELKQDKGTTE